MRRSLLASVLGLVLTLALTTTSLAASTTQTVSVYFSNVSFNSILGGQVTGNANAEGEQSDAGLPACAGPSTCR